MGSTWGRRRCGFSCLDACAASLCARPNEGWGRTRLGGLQLRQLNPGLVGRFYGQCQSIGEALLTLDRTLEEFDLGFCGTEARQELWLHVGHLALSVAGCVIAHAVATFNAAAEQGEHV